MTFRHAIVGATAAASLAAAAPAGAAPVHDGLVSAKLRERYEHHYRAVRRLGGEPGRDIVRDGVRRHGRDRAATAAEVRRSLRVLLRMERSLRGAPAGAATSATGSTAGASPGGSLPACTWQPESGGDYNAVNPTSGARGKYQLMPSTYAAYGGDGSWSPADQDRVAARVYAATGGSAWVNC